MRRSQDLAVVEEREKVFKEICKWALKVGLDLVINEQVLEVIELNGSNELRCSKEKK